MMNSNKKDKINHRVAVIGAGVAGVAMASNLMAEGIDCVVFDKNAGAGGLWFSNYPECGVQTSAELYEYPDKKFPAEIRNRLPKAKEVCVYLEEYIKEKKIEDAFRFNRQVINISKNGENDWIVSSNKVDGSNKESKEKFTFVVLCSGLMSSKPSIPDYEGMDVFKSNGGEVLHTSQWKSIDQLKGKKVVVVGNGKSAADAALMSARVAKERGSSAPPIQLIRRTQWYFPRNILGLIHFKWAFLIRFGAAMFPRYLEVNDPVLKFVHWVTSPFKWVFWRIVEVTLYFQMRLPFRIAPPVGTIDKAALEISGLVTEETPHLQALRRGDIDMRVATISELKPGKAVLSTGEEIELDLLILGTKWQSHFQMLDETLLSKLDYEKDGLWLYRQMLPPQVSGLAFVGSNALTFTNPLTSYLQAMWLCNQLKNGTFPSKNEMETGKEAEKAFKRRYYPLCGQLGGSVESYMLHYHDLLLQEMGLNPMTYGGLLGPMANYLLPVVPSMFKGFCDSKTRLNAPQLYLIGWGM